MHSMWTMGWEGVKRGSSLLDNFIFVCRYVSPFLESLHYYKISSQKPASSHEHSQDQYNQGGCKAFCAPHNMRFRRYFLKFQVKAELKCMCKQLQTGYCCNTAVTSRTICFG